MVVRRFGEVADGVDEHERRRPAVCLVDAADPAVLVEPSGQILQPLAQSALRRTFSLFPPYEYQLRLHDDAAADHDGLPGQE